jgi:hypothetical protein
MLILQESDQLTTPLFATTLVRNEHVRSFQVRSVQSGGWEACRTEDQGVPERQYHADWHRVEQTLAHFNREIGELLAHGWREA